MKFNQKGAISILKSWDYFRFPANNFSDSNLTEQSRETIFLNLNFTSKSYKCHESTKARSRYPLLCYITQTIWVESEKIFAFLHSAHHHTSSLLRIPHEPQTLTPNTMLMRSIGLQKRILLAKLIQLLLVNASKKGFFLNGRNNMEVLIFYQHWSSITKIHSKKGTAGYNIFGSTTSMILDA